MKYLPIYIEPRNGSLVYGVWVSVRTDIKKLNRHLKKWTQEGHYLSAVHPLKPDTKSRNFVEPILRDLQMLRRALKRVY